MKPTPFLLVTAVVEVAAGLFLLVLPGVLLRLLLGMAQLPADVLLVARWVGVALLAIGVASGMARDDRGGAAVRGILGAILVYNVGAVARLLGQRGGRAPPDRAAPVAGGGAARGPRRLGCAVPQRRDGAGGPRVIAERWRRGE